MISTSSSKTHNRCLPGIVETTSSVKIFGTVERLFDFDLNRASLDFLRLGRKPCLPWKRKGVGWMGIWEDRRENREKGRGRKRGENTVSAVDSIGSLAGGSSRKSEPGRVIKRATDKPLRIAFRSMACCIDVRAEQARAEHFSVIILEFLANTFL